MVAVPLKKEHGSRWREVASLTAAEPALARRIVRDLPYLLAEVVYAVESEMAITLADVLVRRLHVAFEVADHGRAAARVATAVLAGRLGWDNARARTEIANYEAEVERVFGIDENERALAEAEARSRECTGECAAGPGSCYPGAPLWMVTSSTMRSRRVVAGSLRMTSSPTPFPTSARPMSEPMLTWPSSNSTESPNTRLKVSVDFVC